MKKLTREQVVELRRLLAKGHTQVEVAKKFGIKQTTVSAIKRFRTWV